MLQKLYNELSLLFRRKDKETYRILYNILGFLPRNLSLYRIALTHSSHSSRSGKKSYMCNERLEFLGDAIIDAVVSDLLYSRYEKEREGFLTKSRSGLVCRETLNDVALKIGLDKLVVAHNTGRQHNSYIFGNAFEAFVGAIYVDRGYKMCKKFLLNRVFGKVVDIEKNIDSNINFKSLLIETSQKRRFSVEFTLVEEKNSAEGQHFTSEVYVCDKLFGVGCGFSKRESQQHAAKEALDKIKMCDREKLPIEAYGEQFEQSVDTQSYETE